MITLRRDVTAAEDTTGRVTGDATEKALARLAAARAICEAEPDVAFENVWHALILLENRPLDRLNRSLIRVRTAAVQR